jgi:hypothetical protein
VASFTPTGAYRWSYQIGGTSQDRVYGLAVDGNAFVTGHMQDLVDFGGGGLTSAGDYDVFLLKLTP